MKTLDDMTEPELHRTLINAAKGTHTSLPVGTTFILIACGESNIGQYVSNMQRDTIPQLLREVADRLERKEDVTR